VTGFYDDGDEPFIELKKYILKSLQLVPVMSQKNPVITITHYF
jgi:hypothetical protein